MQVNRLLLLLLTVSIMACKKDEFAGLSTLTELKGESGVSYQESLAQWNEIKRVKGNSYVYQTTMVSWTGFGSTTELKVEEGRVTARVYQEFKTNQTNGQREITDTYAETKADLGSHPKGASPLTIDDLYRSCAGEYLIVNKETNTLYFETEKMNGVLTLCGFVPVGCMDDCFRGISISSFEWID